MISRFCRDCQEHRPVNEFSANRRSRDGLAFYCRKHLAERSATSRDARRVRPRKHRFPPAGLDMPAEHKWCPDCGEVKPFEQFPKTVTSRTGRATYCLPCHNARGQASRAKVGGSRTYHLTRRYGITAAEADLMLDQQGGVCAICRSAPAAHVDHDHETGAVRALLCFNCNGGLGQFKDDPALLRAGADYVEQHRRRQRPQPQPLQRRRVQVTARPPGRRVELRVRRVHHQDLLSSRFRADLARLLGEA